MKNKYDIEIMPITVDGIKVSTLIQKRTARQAWEDRIACAKLRRLWKETISNSTSTFRTPIFEDKV